MMLTSFTNTVRFMLFFLFALGAMAMPVSSVERRDVFVPPVLYPKAGTVWAVNQKHNVTWYVFIVEGFFVRRLIKAISIGMSHRIQ